MRTIVFITVCVLLSWSCTKTVTGPKGEKGPAGAPGRVVSTGVYTHDAAAWRIDSTEEHGIRNYKWLSEINVLPITDDIIHNGSVQVYVGKNAQWDALPRADSVAVMQSSCRKGQVLLRYSTLHGSLPPKPQNQQVRIVIISGSN